MGNLTTQQGFSQIRDLKVGVFLSYLTLDQTMHRAAAKTMLKWAKKHEINLIVSSVAVKAT